MAARLSGGRRGAWRRAALLLRRDVAGSLAAAFVIAGSVGPLHMSLQLAQNAAAAAEEAVMQAGLDIMLCIPAGPGCSETRVREASEAVLRMAENFGAVVEVLDPQEVKEQISGDDDALQNILELAQIPVILSIAASAENQGRIADEASQIPGVSGVQVRNRQLLLLSEQYRSNARQLRMLGIIQAVAAGAAVMAMTNAGVRGRRSETQLLRMLGAPERLIRRPHILRSGLVGGAGAVTGAALGAWLAGLETEVVGAGTGPSLLLWLALGAAAAGTMSRASLRGRYRDLPL